MALELPIDINSVKGFLANDEGEALYEYALATAALGPCLEVGSYCGKSTVYLGAACRTRGNTLYALDHHRGSEEHQLGEEYHDPDLFDNALHTIDSFPAFRQTLSRAALEQTVVPIVASSVIAARHWATPLGMVFIDGGHSFKAAQCDYNSWATHIVHNGILAIHDIFPDPADGGQAPYEIYQQACASGLFKALPTVNTLGLLQRIG
ncbi:MAG: class I SAM-dependent methyltransferase [Pseudomonadales bacterium]|nr:class I SAM-dependent methyltransferase [Pseudomonadales bacterium]